MTTRDLADAALQLAAALDDRDGKLLVVTGAGVSLASGIPTFRGTDPGAIWKSNLTELATFAFFQSDPVESWRFYLDRFDLVRDARPNPAHRALAAIDRARGRARPGLPPGHPEHRHAARSGGDEAFAQGARQRGSRALLRRALPPRRPARLDRVRAPRPGLVHERPVARHPAALPRVRGAATTSRPLVRRVLRRPPGLPVGSAAAGRGGGHHHRLRRHQLLGGSHRRDPAERARHRRRHALDRPRRAPPAGAARCDTSRCRRKRSCRPPVASWACRSTRISADAATNG